LGVDLGTTSIKLVEFTTERGVPKLVTYGYAERAVADIAKDDSKVILDKVAALLKRLYKQCDIHSYRAVTALPNFSVFNSVITLPVMKKKRVRCCYTLGGQKNSFHYPLRMLFLTGGL